MSECKHEWLVPKDNRTTYKKCGRDGYIYLDVNPQEVIDNLKNQVQKLKDGFNDHFPY